MELIVLSVFVILFLLIGAIISFVNVSRIQSLEKKVFLLETRMRPQSVETKKETYHPEKIPDIELPAREQTVFSKEEQETGAPRQTEKPVIASVIENKKQAVNIPPTGFQNRTKSNTTENAIAKKIERSLLENWTGILGSVIIVAGLSFLGIFVAMNMNPFTRFAMLVCVSVALGFLFMILRRNRKWQKVGLWIRSIAAATFLFACVGGGGIEGLKWVVDPMAGLALLGLGIAVNIVLAFSGGSSVVASIHVLLSLITLFIAPQNEMIFVIASVIALSGVILTYREKWEFHLLLTVSAFMAYIIFYYISLFDQLAPSMRIIGIAGIATVHITAVFVHYRKIYSESAFRPIPLIAHLANWLFLGIGIYLYAPDIYWISVPLFISGACAFILARRAKALGIRWLHLLDTLMSQAIVYMGIISLSRWEVSVFPIISIVFLEALVFLVITLVEKEPLLTRIGGIVMLLLAPVLIIVNFVTFNPSEIRSVFEHSISLFVCLSALAAYHTYAIVRLGNTKTGIGVSIHQSKILKVHIPAEGISIATIFIALFIVLRANTQMEWFIGPDYILAIPFVALLLLRNKTQSDWLGIGLLLTLLIFNASAWMTLATHASAPVYEKIICAIPCFVLDFFAIKLSYVKAKDNFIKWPQIYLFFAHAAVVLFFLTNPLSGLIPGVAWLVLSLIALECSVRVLKKLKESVMEKGNPDMHLFNAGIALIAAFLVIHIAVDLQSERFLFFVRARLLIEIFALAVFAYWGLTTIPEGIKAHRSYNLFHPLFPELILAFLVLTLGVEVRQIYLPICWIALAIATYAAGLKFEKLKRLKFYSIFLFWASTIHVAFVTSPAVTPSIHFYDQAWIFGIVAILAELAYIVLFHKKNGLDDTSFPKPTLKLGVLCDRINRKKNIWIYYPLFVCIALFLFWSFDASILTLLWGIEAFSIFGVSIILRENHFRYLSLIGLGCCLVRLVFFDLASSNTIIRAVVFIGVGAIMLLMNGLYNKFKGRYGE